MKKVFLDISQNSQENTCVRVSFLNFKSFLNLSLFLKICHIVVTKTLFPLRPEAATGGVL